MPGTKLLYSPVNPCVIAFLPWLEVYTDASVRLIWGAELVVGISPVWTAPRRCPCRASPTDRGEAGGWVGLLHLLGWGHK